MRALRATFVTLITAVSLAAPLAAHAEPPPPVSVDAEPGDSDLNVSAKQSTAKKPAKAPGNTPHGSKPKSTSTAPQAPTFEELIADVCTGEAGAIIDTGEGYVDAVCPTLFDKSSSSPAITPQQVSTIAQQATLTLKLPSGKTIFYPEPHTNIHNTTATGYPLWIHTSDPTELTSTITQGGITITITAKRTHLVINTGDKNIVRCTTTTPFPANPKPMQKSPTCGHTYQAPNPAYPVTTTSHWTATWTALGQTGNVPLTQTHVQQLKVQDIVSVLTPSKP